MIRSTKRGRCANCRKPLPAGRGRSFFCSDRCGCIEADCILGAGGGSQCARCGQHCFEGFNEASNGPNHDWCLDCANNVATP